MNQFTIRDIENLCGIKAHTLRIWEQRYQLCVAKRKQSQHRTYDNNDLKELLRVAFLYHNGHKISRIAELTPESIHKLVEKACVDGNNCGVYIHQLTEAGIDLDKEKFEKLVNCLVLRLGMEKCIREIFYPFLERIGLLWITNNVVPAQEHFVSHIIRKKIVLATDGLEPNYGSKPMVLLFAPEGEFHEIPLLAINYFFKKNKVRTVYFGANISNEAIQYYLDRYDVEYLYAHVITKLNSEGLDQCMCSIANRFPGKQIIVSGPAAKVCYGAGPGNLKVVHSLDEMIAFARSLVEKNSTRR